MKRLIVNADDFGFTRDVNRGILEAHRHGILTATTLMATEDAFADAVRIARENPTLDVGCHLVLVGSAGFPPTLAALTRAVLLGRVSLYSALAKQVDRILKAGLQPTHLDTHKHTHLLPPVLDAVARVAEDFRIPWIRCPFDLPSRSSRVGWRRRAVSRSFGFLRPRFRRVLADRGCRATDHFSGFQITGAYGAQDLARLIAELPEGTTEFMCHPGFCTEELRASPTRLQESRERELQALLAPEPRQALIDSGVELTNYRGA